MSARIAAFAFYCVSGLGSAEHVAHNSGWKAGLALLALFAVAGIVALVRSEKRA